MLRLEMYRCMDGVEARVVGFDVPSKPHPDRDLGESVARTITHQSIKELGLAGAVAKFLWDVHTDFPELVQYARR